MLTFENAPHDDRCAIAHECHKSSFIPHPVRASQKEKTDISIFQNFLFWVAFLATILYHISFRKSIPAKRCNRAEHPISRVPL